MVETNIDHHHHHPHRHEEEQEEAPTVVQQQQQQQQQQPSKGSLFTIVPTEVTTMHNWSSSYVRGLEDFMTPILSEKRCTILQHIIRYQSFLRSQQPPLADISAQLCEYSRKLSQPSRDFALKLAIGDALTASYDP
jgi:hypothetical protein